MSAEPRSQTADAAALALTREPVAASFGAVLAPSRASERILEVDIVRAVALVGIVVVNFQSPNLTGVDYAAQGGADHVVSAIVQTFFNGKFYPLFSLLFGFGMAIQMMRAEARGGELTTFYLRRLAALFGIGVLHSAFVWRGDILHVYAFWGLLLIVCARLSNRTLLAAAVVLITVCALQKPLLGALNLAGTEAASDQDFRAYASASTYSSLVATLFGEFAREGVRFKTYLGQLDIPGLFLLGLYAGRRELLQDMRSNAPLIRRVMLASFAIGAVGLAWGFATRRLAALAGDGILSGAAGLLTAPAVTTIAKLYYKPALAIFYACTLLLLLTAGWTRRLRPLSALGRMALTNYLAQCVIGALLFFGLGLYGKVGAAAALVLAIGVYSLQIVLSAWWLDKYRFGPLEWLWRSLSYGRLQPMRLEQGGL